MNRLIPGALALACALALGACNASDLSAIGGAANSGAITPTLQPGQLTAANLKVAGFTDAQITKILGAVGKAQTVAAAICPFVPLAEGLANVTIASSAAGTLSTVTGTVNVVCSALRSAPTYTALGGRHGEMVKAYVDIGTFHRVPVYGVRR